MLHPIEMFNNQVGWSPRQPGRVSDVEIGGPDCGRGLELDDPWGRFQPKARLGWIRATTNSHSLTTTHPPSACGASTPHGAERNVPSAAPPPSTSPSPLSSGAVVAAGRAVPALRMDAVLLAVVAVFLAVLLFFATRFSRSAPAGGLRRYGRVRSPELWFSSPLWAGGHLYGNCVCVWGGE